MRVAARRLPRGRGRLKIAKALGVTMSDLTGRKLVAATTSVQADVHLGYVPSRWALDDKSDRLRPGRLLASSPESRLNDSRPEPRLPDSINGTDQALHASSNPPSEHRSPSTDDAPRDRQNGSGPRSPQNPHTTRASQAPPAPCVPEAYHNPAAVWRVPPGSTERSVTVSRHSARLIYGLFRNS